MSETDEQFLDSMEQWVIGSLVFKREHRERLFALARRGAAAENHGQDAKPSEELKQLRAAMMLKINEKQFLAAVDREGDYECGAGKFTDDKRAHSAFANSENASDPECTCCGGTGITYQTERRCACQPLPPPPSGETHMSDIVERLRKWSVFGYGYEASCDMKEAATAIEAQKANIANAARLLIEQATEIERLRAALREIESNWEVPMEEKGWHAVARFMWETARAALGEKA